MEIIEKNAGFKATKLALMEGKMELGFLVYSKKQPLYVEILYLRVNPNYRRNGYGKILVDEFFEKISEYIGEIRLYAAANYDVNSLSGWDKSKFIPQDKLEKFYEGYGFKRINPWKNEAFPDMSMFKS